MSGICLEKVSGKSPICPLRSVEDDIKNSYQKNGKNLTGKLPRFPEKFGGETDIMIISQVFP